MIFPKSYENIIVKVNGQGYHPMPNIKTGLILPITTLKGECLFASSWKCRYGLAHWLAQSFPLGVGKIMNPFLE